eukprot:gnl/TRDRNA2_/TRDRNA2_199699_c0_seq1.p1 gnl/TRDRNA2_/TRDRNA2_199699_c0~~gnl/TRDRNA2_/TRDRNA2_199699_c0_seq1.p1  ORF type:complete len:103 (+),score=6.92 gnl/TRDRNA2_/TRDRNA2_199699_c0_seq1:55-363(+)
MGANEASWLCLRGNVNVTQWPRVGSRFCLVRFSFSFEASLAEPGGLPLASLRSANIMECNSRRAMHARLNTKRRLRRGFAGTVQSHGNGVPSISKLLESFLF